jgi:chromosome segregation ATPase
MKSRIKMIFSAGLLTPLFVISPVLAVDSAPSPSTQTEQSTTSTATVEKNKQELADRLQKRKDALKIKLTLVQEKRLQTRCKNAQGVVSKLQGRITGIETSRTQVYKNLVDRLTDLQGKLDQKGANTAELKTEITELQAKIATFNTDLVAYKQSVSDLATMDCVTDPTGFKASLEESRTGLKKVHDDGLAVRAYVNDTIKPTLSKIRAELGGEQSATNPTKTEAN